jgi:hypothetical protein
MRVRGFGALATWMAVGVLSFASGATGEAGGPHVPNGNPCAGEELTLKINGDETMPAEVPYGPVAIKGVLHCGTTPIRDAQVAVTSIGYLPEDVLPITGSVTTGLDGSFVYTVPPGPNREVSFGYTSFSDDPGPSVTATATLLVHPQLRLAITPASVRNHHHILWTATVLGAPFPPQGITLVTQVKEAEKWKTFDELVLHHEGTGLIYVYRFDRTFRPATYTFRVALPATGSGGYPYSFGASNAVSVRVKP